jgi:hypothetical protein
MKLRLFFAILLVQLGFAQQRTCGVDQQMAIIMADPQLKQQYLDLQNQFNTELSRLQSLESNKNGQVVNNISAIKRIPVAVHYPSVANSSTESVKNCLRLLAQRQIAILNADYNATNADINLWTNASSFYPGVNVGNMNVSWEIATQNHPSGTGLNNGTLAVTFGTDFLSGADSDTTWSGYCNLVVRNISGGILGYSPLGGSPSNGMTVVVDNNAFGATMSGSPSSCAGFVPGAPYNLGRTLTHELGHFFNLYHTFQACDGSNCATSGDRVCDTPSSDTPWYSCVEGPGEVGNNCGTSQLTMNYMDYVSDSCMYMFTEGQVNRMNAWYNTIVSQLQTNVLANNEFINTNFSIVPNPNNGSFAIQLNNKTDNYTVSIMDSLGREIYNNEFNQTTDLIQNIQIDNKLTGFYFISIQSNGAILNKKIIVK